MGDSLETGRPSAPRSCKEVVMRSRQSVRRLAFLVAVAVPAVVGAQPTGSGRLVEQTRNLGDFSSVHVAAGIEARIEAGARAPIVLRGEDNILPLVRTEVREKALFIGFEPHSWIHSTKPVTVSIRMPRVEALGASAGASLDASTPAGDELRLEASGGGHVRMTSAIKPQRLQMDASGGGEIDVASVEAASVSLHGSGGAVLTLSGRAREGSLHFAGGTTVKASRLALDSLQIHGSGGGDAVVGARTVTGSLSGGSTLHVAAGATVNVETSGGAEVVRER
jgi:hypothetical protein